MAVSDYLYRMVNNSFYLYRHYSMVPSNILVLNSSHNAEPLLVRRDRALYEPEFPRNILLIYKRNPININNSISKLYKYLLYDSDRLITIIYKQNIYYVGNGSIFDSNFRPIILTEFNMRNTIEKVLIDRSVWENNSDPVKASIKKTAFPYLASQIKVEVNTIQDLVACNVDSEFSTEAASRFILDNFDDFIETSTWLNSLICGTNNALGLNYRS